MANMYSPNTSFAKQIAALDSLATTPAQAIKVGLGSEAQQQQQGLVESFVSYLRNTRESFRAEEPYVAPAVSAAITQEDIDSFASAFAERANDLDVEEMEQPFDSRPEGGKKDEFPLMVRPPSLTPTSEFEPDAPADKGLMSPPADTAVTDSEEWLDAAVERIKGLERFESEAYRATKGEEFLTIGYGHYGSDVKSGQTITQREADELLMSDINERLPAIRKAIPAFDNLSDKLKVELLQGWFRGDVSGSPKTIALINEGRFDEAAEEFLDNREYKTARERGRAGIIPRMNAIADALREEE